MPELNQADQQAAQPQPENHNDNDTPGHRNDFVGMLKVEGDEIKERRKNRGIGNPESENWAGLSMSGGGVRSACFNLGLLEALDERKTPAKLSGSGTRYLELFDYVSAVSGGSYVAGHLAMSMMGTEKSKLMAGEVVPTASENQTNKSIDTDASKPDKATVTNPPSHRFQAPRVWFRNFLVKPIWKKSVATPTGDVQNTVVFGEIAFTSNSIPHWFWALGVWFLGFVFQTLKTGSFLVLLLGVIALALRTCDAPDVIRFVEMLGMRSDVSRGFVPFWITLGAVLVAYSLHPRKDLAKWWLYACAAITVIYVSLVSIAHKIESHVWFSWHVSCLAVTVPVAIGFHLAKAKRWGDRCDTDESSAAIESWMRWMSLLPMLVALVCLAGLFTTGDVGVRSSSGATDIQTQENSQKLARWGDWVYRGAIAAFGTMSLAFLRYRDLLKSTRKVTDQFSNTKLRPVYQVIVFLCSYGFLLLLVFVLYGAIARENVSGYNERREIEAGKAFDLTDFVDPYKPWERIDLDSKDKNSPWNGLATSLVKARDQAALTYNYNEDVEDRAIMVWESLPWVVRCLFRLEKSTEYYQWRYVWRGCQLYDTSIRWVDHRDRVAKAIADVLKDPTLYRKLPPNSGEAESFKLPVPADPVGKMTPDRYSESWAEYKRKAKHLAEPGTPTAAVAQNNWKILRLYLGDLVRDRDDKIVFASVVWAEDQWTRVRIVVIAGGIWLLCCFVNVNTFSLQAFYRDHVCERWLRGWQKASGTGSLNGCGMTYQGKITDVDQKDRRAPLLLINATVQGNRSVGADPELSSHIFTFSPVGAGSRATKFFLGDKGHKVYGDFVNQNRLDVGQMVAISGAFLSPGQVTNPAIAAVLHLLNIQTGWWAREPKSTCPATNNPDPKNPEKKDPRWKTFLMFHFFHSLGIDIEGDDRFLLTDGAHVENLGLKVLLDRRCSLIVASDCSQEDEEVGHRFGALIEVIRQAQVDGIEIGPFLSAKAYRHWLVTRRIEEVGSDIPDCRHTKSWGLDLLQPPRLGQGKGQTQGHPALRRKVVRRRLV